MVLHHGISTIFDTVTVLVTFPSILPVYHDAGQILSFRVIQSTEVISSEAMEKWPSKSVMKNVCTYTMMQDS